MKLRTQLIAAIVVFVILLVFLSGFVISTNQQVDSLSRQQDIANSIAIETGELGYLSNDYILHREPQLADRWNAKYESIAGNIGRLSVDKPEHQAIVSTLAANLRNTKSVFDDIASTPLKDGTNAGFVELSWSRIAVLNQGMIFDASRLAGLIHDEETGVRAMRLYFTFALMGAFGALLLTGYFIVYRRTLRSLDHLQQGVAIVGSGNFNQPLEENYDDEIGNLSRSFNRMIAQLREVTASKADLEWEMAGRKMAEEDLIRKNEDLNATNEELAATEEELHQNLEELTRAEKTVRESEARFRALTTASSDVVYRMSPDWSEMRQLRGQNFIADTEKPDRNWLAVYIHPEDQAHVKSVINEAIRTKSIFELEHRVLRVDGTIGWTFSRAIPLLDDNGEIIEWFGAASDITARKVAEEALKASEEKFRVLFTRMVEGSALHEIVYNASGEPVDYRILDINPSFERILELKREDVIGKTSTAAYGVDAPPYFELYRRVAETGQPEEFEVFFEPMKKHFTISAYSPEPGKFATIFVDITGRRNAEEKVRNLLDEVQREKERLSALIRNIPDEVWFADANEKIELMNPAVTGKFGEFAAASDGVRTIAGNAEVYRPDGTPRPVEEAPPLRALKGEVVREQEEIVRIPATGEVRTRQVNAAPVRDANGTIIGSVAVVRDITARKQSEENVRNLLEEVQREKERLSSLINSISDEVWFADSQKKFTLANPAALREFALGIDTVDIEKFAASLEVYHPDGSPRPVEEAPPLRALKGEEVRNLEEMVRTPGTGEVRYRQVNSNPVRDTAGNIIGAVSVVRDITELIKAEEELKRKNIDLNALNEELTATQEELRQNIDDISRSEEILRQNESQLKHTLAEKEVLLSEIHHRVKNNLTAFISLLSLEGSYEESAAGTALKKDLQNRARSMALVHETLYKTHKFDEVDMKVYLSTLVEQIVNSYQSPKSLRTLIDVEDISLDLNRATPIGLIINELVTNSLKYAFPQDTITCRADRKEPCTIGIRLTKEDGTYLLKISDNGVGLPKGLDIRTTKSLGLKLVNFLASHQLRAKIEVRTDRGTEFIFRLNKREDYP